MFRASLAFERVVLSVKVTSLLLLMLVGIFDDTAEFYYKEKVSSRPKLMIIKYDGDGDID